MAQDQAGHHVGCEEFVSRPVAPGPASAALPVVAGGGAGHCTVTGHTWPGAHLYTWPHTHVAWHKPRTRGLIGTLMDTSAWRKPRNHLVRTWP